MNKFLLFPSFVLLPLFLKSQDFAIKQLESSPRHHEWVKVTYNERVVHSFAVYPEIPEKATVAIVIHENRGLTDWVRSFADQLAAAGYIALAPDLLSGFNDSIQKTSDFVSSDDARNAIYELDPDQVEKDLNAVQNYARGIPAANGKTVSIGFCWGGTQSFRMATYNSGLTAAIVFYGSAPEKQVELQRISAPVYGFYAGNDERINAGIQATEKMMSETGRKYEHKIYETGGHGFMRQGDDPAGTEGNRKARDEAWMRMLEILKSL